MDRDTQILAADDQIVSYATAVLAKNKGFNYCGTERKHILTCYVNNGEDLTGIERSHGDKVLAPTQTMLQRWLRENHKQKPILIVTATKDGIVGYVYSIKGVSISNFTWIIYPTYELAVETALIEALNLLPDVKLTMH